MVKRLAAVLLALVLFVPAASALAPDISSLGAEELLALRASIDARLRSIGGYPYVELRLGDAGPEVLALQQQLASLGHYTGEASGKYDTKTAAAVQTFEKANRLEQNGVASIQEQMMLFALGGNAMAATAPAAAPQPTAKPAEATAVYVWIPKSGSKYHSKSTCSNMKNPRQVTLEEAKAAGYDPCSRCDPPR